MLIEERFQEILEIVNAKKTVTVQELTERLNTSESTIRRDLAQLHKKGKLIKVHGGATALDVSYSTQDLKMEEKYQLYTEEKLRIARYAAALIQPEDFVFIDAGTTTELLTEQIAETRASYVTNSMVHAKKLAEKGCKTFILGGEIKGTTEAIVGPEALEAISRYNFTKGFFGTNGVTLEEGFTTPELNEAAVKRLAMEHSRQRFILCDGSKFNQVSQITFGRFEEAQIITSGLTDPSYKKYEHVVEAE
ncbi:MAG: DeoR/GlpR family DNA-binding transcription regulator [Lachnospiraceae bacterium]